MIFYSVEAVIRMYFQSKINVTAVDAKVMVAVKSALRKMDGRLGICVMMIWTVIRLRACGVNQEFK